MNVSMQRGGSSGKADTGSAGTGLPLVLLPGTLCDARVFAPLVARLPGRTHMVQPITGGETAAELARAILAAAPPYFVLIGFSLGGFVGLEMAAMAPGRVGGLALIASNARADVAGNAPARRADVARAAAAMAPFVLERLWPRYVSGAALLNMQLRALVVEMAETLGLEALRTQTEVAISRSDSRARLGSLPMPVLALCGANDTICTPEMHREIVNAAVHGTLCVVPDAGHLVLLEAPDEVAANLVAWLDTIPPISPEPAHRPATRYEELT